MKEDLSKGHKVELGSSRLSFKIKEKSSCRSTSPKSTQKPVKALISMMRWR
jgi:hypothetical protein